MSARDDLVEAELRQAVAVERVTQAALLHAADQFNQQAEDPGWTAELHDDMLVSAIRDAAADIEIARAAKKRLEGGH